MVTDCSLNIDFGLDSSIRKLGDKGRSMICSGRHGGYRQLTVFITDKTLLMKAKNSEELSLDLSFAIDEGNKLTFSVPEVQLSYNGPTVDGPTGIKMDQSFSAYFNDNADNASVVVTLVNDVESY